MTPMVCGRARTPMTRGDWLCGALDSRAALQQILERLLQSEIVFPVVRVRLDRFAANACF